LLLSALKATKEGSFLSGYRANEDGVMGETAEASSSIISLDRNMVNEVAAVGRIAVKEGE